MIKQSTPQALKPKDPKAFLFIGPPGGAKTQTAMQFPSVCFFDLEGNLDGPEHFLRNERKDATGKILWKAPLPTLDYKYSKVAYDDSGKPREAWSVFDQLLTELKAVKNDDSIKTIVIDNLTFVNHYIIQKIYKQQGVQAMEMRHYDSLKSGFINLLTSHIRGSGKTSICTCHEFIVTKPNPGDMQNPTVVGYEPAVQGKITDYFGGFFTDMWRFTSEVGAGNKTVYRIQTARDTYSDLKNSMGMPPKIEIPEGELAWTKLEPYLRGNL